jgi:hypothetical protein
MLPLCSSLPAFLFESKNRGLDTSVNFCRTTRCHIPKDCTLQWLYSLFIPFRYPIVFIICRKASRSLSRRVPVFCPTIFSPICTFHSFIHFDYFITTELKFYVVLKTEFHAIYWRMCYKQIYQKQVKHISDPLVSKIPYNSYNPLFFMFIYGRWDLQLQCLSRSV